MIFDKHANLKYKYGNRHFWAEGYYVSTVGLNEATVRKYIQEQEKYDIAMDKLSVKEYEDPFKGEPVLQTPFKGGRRVKGIVAWTEWKPASLGAGRYCPFIGASKPPVWRVVMIFP